MRETWQVVLAGEGGQGLIVAGVLLAEAASLFEGKNAAQTQSYGIATRGGFTKSEVVISTKEIIYPGAEEPDLVLALSREAGELLFPRLPAGALFFYDRGLAGEAAFSGARAYGFPFGDAARELGRPGAANLVALGVIVALTGVVREDSLRQAIQKRFGRSAAEANLRAFGRGLEMAKMTSSLPED